MLIERSLLYAVYVLSMLGLALYGFQALWLTWHYFRRNRVGSRTASSVDETAKSEWPTVAVHLPIYNERHVAQRVIQACTRLSYPRDKLRILILDDSDDTTSVIINRAVQIARDDGCNIRVIRRYERHGYKAGALSNAMGDDDAAFTAVFDADFVPPEDFLLRTMPCFLGSGNERVGYVQTRWGHLNRRNSLLTRCEAVALDGHFVVEQNGRSAAQFAFGFNGSGGVWRRDCILDPAVGGWQADTLCEDLDLSYRAQLAGWRGVFLNDVVVPAELPPQLLAYKRQQFRWALGGVQTLRKLGWSMWSSDWTLTKRLAATLHLGSYLLPPALLALLLITLPLALTDTAPAAPLALLSLMSVGPPLLYASSQRHIFGRSWPRSFILLPMLMLLGTGLILNNSIAAIKGLFGGQSEFLRTPKFDVTADASQWKGSSYRLPLQPIIFGEALLALYALLTCAVFAIQGNYLTMAFVSLYVLGFGFMAGLGLWQEWSARTTVCRYAGLASASQRGLEPAATEYQAASLAQDN